MKKAALQELYDLEKSYWWHVGRLTIIAERLKEVGGKKTAKILNVGSGTGGTIDTLEKFGSVHNVDTSKQAISFLKKHGFKSQLIDGGELPFKAGSFDILTALDVLEHIESDTEVLKDWLRVLKPGGTMVLTVPAYQWLWSQHDVINNHYRRYTRKELKQKIQVAGFEVKKSSYAIVFSFPLVVGSRFVSKLSGKNPQEYSSFVQLPKPVNSLFINLLKIEAKLGRLVSYPFGTSVLVVAQKPLKPRD